MPGLSSEGKKGPSGDASGERGDNNNVFAAQDGFQFTASPISRSLTNPESPGFQTQPPLRSFPRRSDEQKDSNLPPPFEEDDEEPVSPSDPPSHRASNANVLTKTVSQPGLRTANLWARSRSVAEGHKRPSPSSNRARSLVRSDTRRGSDATVSSRPALPDNADNNTTDTDSQPDTAKGVRGADSRIPYAVNTEVGTARRRMSSTKGRWDRKLSITEYFKPTEFYERGRRPATTPKTASSPSESAFPLGNSVRPSLERKGSSAFQTNRGSEFPFYTAASRRPSSAIDAVAPKDLGRELRPSIVMPERAILQPGVYFESRRLKDPSTDLPWLKQKADPRKKWLSLIPVLGILLGFGLAALNMYMGTRSVPVHNYCMVYEDDFSSGTLNDTVWTKEIQVGGFGNGEFEETTGGDENVFIKDDMLHILPTLQDFRLLTSNYTLNLTEQGICTSDMWYNCVATTNTTNGTIIPPVKSGRINTKKGANIKFGRVEVVAKMPQGDWIWPAIWLMPTDSVYGAWPKSGEIDIAESRGNNWTYQIGGNNIISSALHWGPDQPNDAWWRTYGKTSALHSTFSENFHTFGLEWSEKYLYTYVDNRLMQVLYTRFSTPFWNRGDFPLTYPNGSAITNPWAGAHSDSAPFDQDFYLILNVAVGGTNGWFVDGMANKPWVDSTHTAPTTFWAARNEWLPTWDNKNGAALQVKSVKIWQQQGYNGCGDQAIRIP